MNENRGRVGASAEGSRTSSEGQPSTNRWMKSLATMTAFLLVAFQAVAGTLNPFSYSADTYVAGATATYTFTYTTVTADPNMIIYAIFPAGFSTAAIGSPMDTGLVSVTINGFPAVINAATSWGTGTSLAIRLNPATVAGGSNIVVTAQGIVNHATPGSYNFTFIRTADGGGNAIDAPASIDPIVITEAAPSYNLLFVSDTTTDSVNIPAVLTGDGHTVTVVTNDYNAGDNPTLRGDLSAYDAVYWSATDDGEGGLDHTNVDVFTNLTSFVTAGGRVFVTGYDSIASSDDPLLWAFIGATGSRDGGSPDGPCIDVDNALTNGTVNIRNVQPTGGYGDQDTVTGLAGDTIGVCPSGG